MPKKQRQPDDPSVDFSHSSDDYKTRWTYYHCALVFGVWVIAACCVIAIYNGWGSM